jgi:hypothetical protein
MMWYLVFIRRERKRSERVVVFVCQWLEGK